MTKLDPDLDYVRPVDVPRVTGGAFTLRMTRRYIAQGKLPVCKPGGKTGPALIRVSDLKQFLSDHTVPARKS